MESGVEKIGLLMIEVVFESMTEEEGKEFLVKVLVVERSRGIVC